MVVECLLLRLELDHLICQGLTLAPGSKVTGNI